ncbi:MAG TPA: invasin domain 3-containing protein, partial [Gemmatimonadaceae bacterium]|nr:invasin domain 3-containing protein [Gemmatimonadaceae bacterium]
MFTLQASDTLQVVGAKIPFVVGPGQHVDVARGTTPLVGAKVQLGSDNRSVFDVSGDTLLALARGTAHVTITLLGSNLGDNPPETTLTVRAVAGGVAIRDSTSITLKSLNDTLAIRSNVLAQGRVPIVPADTVLDSLISSDTTIVRVVKAPNALPILIARANGNATLTAVADTARSTIPIHVVQALKKYVFTPSQLSMPALTADTIVAVAPADARGNLIPFNTPGLPTPVFSSSAAGIFTVTPVGTDSAKLHSVGVGTANLHVVAGTTDTTMAIAVAQVAQSVAITGNATDTIFAINDTLTIQPVAFDNKNVTIQNRSFIFNALDPTVVTVTNGVVKGLKLGSTTVTAKMDAATATVTIVVLNLAKSVQVTHTVDLTTVGDSATLAGAVLNKLGVPITGIPVTWTALDTTIAAVGPTTGIVVGRGIGVTKVIGSITAGAADTSTITVENRISQVDITSPDTTMVAIGDTFTVRTNFRNSRGAPVPNSAATWTSTDPTVVTVANGFLTAKAAGLSAIYATDPLNPARFDSVRITVTNAPASVALNRHLDTLTSPSLQIQYVADVRNARTAVITNPTLTWRTTNNTVASVTASGLVTSLAVGATKIIAEANGTRGLHADTATLVVQNIATQLTVSPTSATIPSVGATLPLAADARNATGGAVTGVTFTWTSTDTTVAKVDGTGLVTGIGVGSATVSAHFSTLTAPSTITVTNAPDTIRITSGPITLASINDSIQPAVTLKNAIGAALPRTAAQWLSDDGTIARVTSDGTVIAVAAGTTKIRAQNSLNTARRDSVTVTVTNAPASIVVSPALDTLPSLGRTATYAATVRNARGDVIVGASILWLSRSPSVVSINASTGNATSVGSGTTYVVGTAGSVLDSGKVVVSNLASSISASPAPVTLTSIGQTQSLTTTVRNEQGNLIAGPNVTYSTANAAIATVNSSGVVTATGVGSTSVTVTSDAVSTPVTVTVTNYPTLVDITSNDTTLASVNDSYSASVNFRNGLSAVLPRDAVTWSTGNQLVAVVSSTGVISAVGAGATYIRAISPGNATIRDSVLVTVTNAPATLTVSPAGTTTLASIGVTTNYAASVRNARGDSLAAPNPAVTWTSRTPSVATVSGTGVVTSVAQGSSIIVAAAGTAKDSATVTVAQVASTSQSVIQVSTSSVTADGASTVVVTVRARDANGRNLRVPGTAVAMSLSGTGTLSGVTTVNDSTFTATLTAPSASGNGTVSATVNGVAISSGNQTVTWTAGAATKYVVTSSNSTPTVGTTVTITAQLADVNSNPIATSGKTITWSSTGGGSFGAATSVTNPSGVATVTFTVSATASTHHQVTATDGTPLTGTSGDILTVSSAPSNYLVTPGSTSPAAGSVVTLTAQLRDAGNNAIASAGQTVTWGLNNGAFTPSAATSTTNASGIASVTVTTPASPAGQTVTVTATTGTVSGSSGVITTVPGAASATTTNITSSAGTLTAGGTATLTVHAKDANGNALASSGGTVVLSTTIGALSTIVDNGNGTYTATLTTTTSGTATVSGTIGGVAIAGGNAVVTVNPGAADAAHTTATVPAGSAGSLTTIPVQAKDANGNNLTSGGATVAGSVTGANTATASVTDNGNGTYTLTYTPSVGGTDAVAITLGGTAI